jgi:hypothetical protein
MILAGDRAYRAISELNDSVANFLSAPFIKSNGRFGARRAAAWGRIATVDPLPLRCSTLALTVSFAAATS